jgi:hypothetical protein
MTGIATGSCSALHSGTFLQVFGLKGEYVVDERVWITKGHHPTLMPFALSMKSDKVICVVRNPIDSIISLANIILTMSHAGVVNFDFPTLYPEWWDYWVRNYTIKQANHFDIQMRQTIKENINPIYIVRYEDLCSNLKPELTGMMKFLLDIDDLSGTNIERLIDQIQ